MRPFTVTILPISRKERIMEYFKHSKRIRWAENRAHIHLPMGA